MWFLTFLRVFASILLLGIHLLASSGQGNRSSSSMKSLTGLNSATASYFHSLESFPVLFYALNDYLVQSLCSNLFTAYHGKGRWMVFCMDRNFWLYLYALS